MSGVELIAGQHIKIISRLKKKKRKENTQTEETR